MPMFVVTYPDQAKTDPLITAVLAACPEAQIALAHDYKLSPTPDLPIGAESAAEADPELLARARKYVDAIRPGPTQHTRMQLLRDIAIGADTLRMSGGEARCSPRGAVSGLARSLAKAFPDCIDHMDQLFPSKRTYFPDGNYRGVEYRPTVLGWKVLQLLEEEGSI